MHILDAGRKLRIDSSNLCVAVVNVTGHSGFVLKGDTIVGNQAWFERARRWRQEEVGIQIWSKVQRQSRRHGIDALLRRTQRHEAARGPQSGAGTGECIFNMRDKSK